MTFAFGASNSALAVNLMGNYFGTQDTFDSLVNPLVAQFPGTKVDAQSHTDYTEVLLFNAQGLPLQSNTPDAVCRSLDCTVCSEISLSPTTSSPKYVMEFCSGLPFNPFRSL
jgi:hypothetical protein